MKRPGRAQRVARDFEIVGPLDLERAEVRIAAHHRHLEHACTRMRAAFPAGPSRSGARRSRAESSQIDAVERDAAARRTEQGRRAIRSSVVLPDPFGPRMPTRPPRGIRALTPLSTGCRFPLGERHA